MVKTLYARLALGLFALLLTIGVVYAAISLYTVRHYSASVNQQLNRDLAEKLVADRDLITEDRLDMKALKQLFALYMTVNPSIEIYLLDAQGKILSYSADPAKIKRQRVSLAPIEQLLRDRDAYPVLGDDPRQHDRQKVFSVTPIPSAEQPEGYLYVVLRGEEYEAAELMARSEHLMAMSGWALVLSLGFGMLAGLAVFRMLTRRLERLSQGLEQFRASDMRCPQPLWASSECRPRDEIDNLTLTFDRMAQRIAEQIEQLQEQDRLRRRLVAQVSHDLRTPLASMQGYVESLRMKQASLSADEQARFLDVALAEGRRLSRLVDELFELAALDAQEKQPQLEPFAAAELVFDVVHKHQPEAERHGVALNVAGGESLPPVLGDLGMTERVLDNLINNALRHTPAGGRIDLRFDADCNELRLQVCDNGSGIAEADLPHVFDPFYRADANGESGHAGLGLAIAQRIMILQGGRIDVASNAPQTGATFTLALPLKDTAH